MQGRAGVDVNVRHGEAVDRQADQAGRAGNLTTVRRLTAAHALGVAGKPIERSAFREEEHRIHRDDRDGDKHRNHDGKLDRHLPALVTAPG